jgi:hypothetical protein
MRQRSRGSYPMAMSGDGSQACTLQQQNKYVPLMYFYQDGARGLLSRQGRM